MASSHCPEQLNIGTARHRRHVLCRTSMWRIAVVRTGLIIACCAFACLAVTARAETIRYGTQDIVATDLRDATMWSPCAWDAADTDALAQCAFVRVPLDHSQPDGPKFQVLVKRRPSRSRERAQMWLVHGGPGASATAGMADLSFGLANLRDDVSLYAVDHRGVGGSDRLGCEAQEAEDSVGGSFVVGDEWVGCLQAVQARYGSRLNHMSTNAAAGDLAALIDKFRTSDSSVFVYGASYGTYLVRRYLALTDRPPDGVILEGIVAANGGMAGYDQRLETGALAVLAACDTAPACSRHFDAPLKDEVATLLQELEDGHCTFLNLEASVTRQLLAAMTFFHDTRVLIPPLVSRLKRCAWRDIWFVWRLAGNFSDRTRNDAYSPVLHMHVVLSEMYRPAQTAPELERQFHTAVLSTGMEMTYVQLYDAWPKYDAPPSAAGTKYAGPILALQGGLDAPTPLAMGRAAMTSFRGEHQHLVVFPQGAHGVTGATPTLDGTDCARSIVLAFVETPTAPPDRSCIQTIQPLDWSQFPTGAIALAETKNIWGE